MPTRREILKYFGVGSVIAPVVAGAANLSTQARIIEPPRVELITPKYGLKELPEPILMADVSAVEMTLVMKDGTTRRATAIPYAEATGAFPGLGAHISIVIGQEVRGVSPEYRTTAGSLYGTAVLWP